MATSNGVDAGGALLGQLRRLATTAYADFDEQVRDALAAGCEVLRLPIGAFEAPHCRMLYPTNLAVALPPPAPEAHGVRTFPFEAETIDSPLACYISANAADGALTFGSARAEDARRFLPAEKDFVTMLASALGRGCEVDTLRREHTRLGLELARQAQQDPLTGLANRGQFSKHLDSAIARAMQEGSALALVFIDLDRLKQVNDTLGHAAGDQLLSQVAARFASAVDAGDVLARVGGDEFTLLIAGAASREQVRDKVSHLLDAVRAPFTVAGSELFLTASAGISLFPEDAVEAAGLMKAADAAMYLSKSQGKNDFRFFTKEIVLRGARRLELETELRRALERHEFRVCYMPLMGAASGKLEGLEALLAWTNPRFGSVGASRFIPVAEENGMIVPIGAWVLDEVCRNGGVWRPPLRIAINVSPLQFAHRGFVDQVLRTLAAHGMPPECLEIELTESTIMRDMSGAVRRLERLRAAGVSIAIDDFGTGYSSLSYLRQLPVDSLKIDQSFVAGLGKSGVALALVHTIVVLAHTMGLKVVAEGVETREQMELLRASGCDRLQGHLFGEPLQAAQTAALIAERV